MNTPAAHTGIHTRELLLEFWELGPVAAIYAGDWGGRAPKARVSSAVGARIEAPSAPRRVGCGEGVSPSLAPSPEKFSIFELEKVSFGAFWVLLLQLN